VNWLKFFSLPFLKYNNFQFCDNCNYRKALHLIEGDLDLSKLYGTDPIGSGSTILIVSLQLHIRFVKLCKKGYHLLHFFAWYSTSTHFYTREDLVNVAQTTCEENPLTVSQILTCLTNIKLQPRNIIKIATSLICGGINWARGGCSVYSRHKCYNCQDLTECNLGLTSSPPPSQRPMQCAVHPSSQIFQLYVLCRNPEDAS
jgi:hypothetical protein